VIRLFAALPFAFALCAATPLSLTRNGASDYTIAVAPNAPAPEQRAARELQRFLEEMSGARLPIVAACASKRCIQIGSSYAPRKFGAEEYWLKTDGETLMVTGGRPRGTLYGVYTLLDKLGCRWYTTEVSRIPRRPTIALAPLDEIRKPDFEYREPFFTEAFDRDWAARNRVNGNSSRLDESTGGKVRYFPFVHSFNQLVAPAKYFQQHPEYFSLIDGKRKPDQLCLTNPEALRIATATVFEWIRAHPDATIFSVSQNDGDGWCECDRCRRVEREEGNTHQGPILRFVNAVASEVGVKHPDVLIDTLAYYYSEDPPANVRPRANVRIRLCAYDLCAAHPYGQCDYNESARKNLVAWSRITNQLYVWHYNANFHNYLPPFPDFDELAADVPYYKRHGVVGLFMQGATPGGGGGENAELRAWVLSRLLWDTRANTPDAVNEFIDAVYGKAAPYLRAYHKLLHNEIRPAPAGLGGHLWIFGVPSFSDGLLPRARELFRQAAAAAENDAVRRRVAKARLPLDYYALTRESACRFRDGVYAPADAAALRQRLLAFLDTLRGYSMQSIHEGQSFDWDEKQWNTYLKPFPFVTLEDRATRADIVPELNGRVLRFVDKRSGLDLVRRITPGDRSYPDTGGLVVYVHADYKTPPLTTKWRLAHAAPPREAVVEGVSANGLRLRRTLRLEEGVLKSTTRVENPTPQPIEFVLQARGFFDAPELAFSFGEAGGAWTDRELRRPGAPPAGAQTFEGAAVPAGLWAVRRSAAGLRVINTFSPEQVSRCVVDWSVRGPKRVSLNLFSPRTVLAPGQTLELRSDYRAAALR
jgi:hypothetical protein